PEDENSGVCYVHGNLMALKRRLRLPGAKLQSPSRGEDSWSLPAFKQLQHQYQFRCCSSLQKSFK
ncbi:hypothetical protein ACFL27_26550, partial [candidate division CSSED10-310 bacterium]